MVDTRLFRDAKLIRPNKRVKVEPYPVIRGSVLSQAGYPIQFAYIKLLPTNLRAVEAACAWIAREMGLPLPEAIFVTVSKSMVPQNVPWPYKEDSAICFATLEIGLAQPVKNIQAEALAPLFRSWPHLLASAVFDHLVANDDRSQDNLLIDGQNAFWLIDHSRALGGAGQTPFSDPFPSFQNIFLDLLKVKSLADRLKMQQELLSLCAAATLAVEKVPFEGLRIEEQLASQIQRFLRARVRALVAMLQQELGLPDLFQTSGQAVGPGESPKGFPLQ